MYAAADVTTERMGMIKGRKGRRTEEPLWKKRIKGNIETWRKDLSTIEEVRRGNMRLKQREGKVEQKISSRGKGHFVCLRHVETKDQGRWS